MQIQVPSRGKPKTKPYFELTLFLLVPHCVVPRYRRNVQVSGVDELFKHSTWHTATEFQSYVTELEAPPEHAHPLCEFAPPVGVHPLVRHLKGRSSLLLRQELSRLRSRLPTVWTNAYLVAAVGATGSDQAVQ